MRLEHHLVGGYVRYISPYIIIIIIIIIAWLFVEHYPDSKRTHTLFYEQFCQHNQCCTLLFTWFSEGICHVKNNSLKFGD